jgi:hypothetical protein
LANPYYQGPTTDHFDGTRFFNPGHPSTDRPLADLLRWRMRGHKEKWPDSVPVRQTRPQQRVGSLAVTMVGHASLLIQVADLNIAVDPVWSERASPVRFAGPKRLTAPGIAFEDLPSIDTVLITHTHYDHLDAPTLGQPGACATGECRSGVGSYFRPGAGSSILPAIPATATAASSAR